MSRWYECYIGGLFRDIGQLPEFEKELKKLRGRFPTLEDDLQVFMKAAMTLLHKQKMDTGAIFHITDLRIESPRIYKGKKFACKALKGKGCQSGIRVIYAYHEEDDKIEFVEIYFKGDKESEDRARIQKYWGR